MTDESQPDVNEAAASEDSSNSNEGSERAKSVPVENRIAEMNRKAEKRFGSLETKIDQLINFVSESQQRSGGGADKASQATDYEDDPVVVARSEVQNLRAEMLKEKQAASLQEACEIFPELDQQSESFDEDFYKAVDQEFRKLSSTKDPHSPLKAAKYVALEQGKIERLTRSKLLQDESRRSRLLGEGGTGQSRAQKKSSDELPANLSALADILKVDKKGLKDHMKKNASRYGMKAD